MKLLESSEVVNSFSKRNNSFKIHIDVVETYFFRFLSFFSLLFSLSCRNIFSSVSFFLFFSFQLLLNLKSLLEFSKQYKVLQVDLNSSHFFSILFGYQAIFEFPSGILRKTLNPSSGLNSCYSAPFELRSKKICLILRTPVFNWLWLFSASNARDNSNPSRDST